MCCGIRLRGSVPQPQSSSLALPCQILVSVDGCQSLTAFGSCIHWMPAPSRRPKTPAGTAGKAQGGLPLGNPVCLWQTELFKLNLKSSPSSSGYNRRRRLAPRSSRKQQAERTSVRAAPIVCPEESPLLATIGDNFAVSKSPLVGIDAPTPARGQGLQPYGALTLFFRWRKKSVQKKASGTATPGKSPLLPILAAGLAMSRAAQLDCQH